MANRPQEEGLAGLTVERLEKLAAVLDNREGVPPTVSVCRDAAALCRAVANAERWLQVQDRGISYDPQGDMGGRGFFAVDHVTAEWSSAYKTLAAALASIHPEAGGTA